MSKSLNLQNKKFGRLVATKIVGKNKKGNNLWECRCECGNKKQVPTSYLTSGTTKSCGCLHVENGRKHGGRNKKPLGEANFLDLFRRYKRSAKKRNIEFSLEEYQFRRLMTFECHYCGTRPNQTYRHCKGTNGLFVHNGMDRLNPNVGYTVENSRACCKRCNYAKGQMSETEFLNMVVAIYYNTQEIFR